MGHKYVVVLAAGKSLRMGELIPPSKLFLTKDKKPILSNIFETWSKGFKFILVVSSTNATLVKSFVTLVYPKLPVEVISLKNSPSPLFSLKSALPLINDNATQIVVTVADSHYSTCLNEIPCKSICVSQTDQSSKDYIWAKKLTSDVKWLNKTDTTEKGFYAYTGTFSVECKNDLKNLCKHKTIYSLVSNLMAPTFVNVSNKWTDLGTLEKYRESRKAELGRKTNTETWFIGNQVVKYFPFNVKANIFLNRLRLLDTYSYNVPTNAIGNFVSFRYIKGEPLPIEKLSEDVLRKLFDSRLSTIERETHLKNKFLEKTGDLVVLNNIQGMQIQKGVYIEKVDAIALMEFIGCKPLGSFPAITKIHGDPTLSNIILSDTNEALLIDPSSSDFHPSGLTVLYELSRLYASVKFNFTGVTNGDFYFTKPHFFFGLVSNLEIPVVKLATRKELSSIVSYAKTLGISEKHLNYCAAIHMLNMFMLYENKDVQRVFLYLGVNEIIKSTKVKLT